MAQLWGGRFTKETDQLVYNFNASISFDQKFFREDIEGSIAHVVMLEKQGILTAEEKDAIVKGLTGIREDVENGKLEITSEYEDIHSFVEANLIDRIGDAGKKLHTGRSRNDQVALDMKLYVRNQIVEIDSELKELLIKGYLKHNFKVGIMGNWKRILQINSKGGCVGARMICPVCNVDNRHDEYMKYCPNCGARLENNIGNSGEEHFLD